MPGVSDAMHRRLSSLTATNRRLQHDIARHVDIEAALQRRVDGYAKRWNAAQILQQDLRRLTRRMLREQEEQRMHLSRQLQDVIGQSLLGVHVRLLAIKREARCRKAGIAKGIVSTQHLVRKSARIARHATAAMGKA